MRILIANICFFSTLTAFALVVSHDRGSWPQSWPRELEPLRDHAQSIEWATGSQEDSHYIPFPTRAEFERFWPAIAKLLKPGSQLILRTPQSEREPGVLDDLTVPSVIIHAPSASVAFDGKMTLRTGYVWPESVYLPDGTLPEYIVEATENGIKKWVPLEVGKKPRGFRFRARVDITLVSDGNIIDLNRIRFPCGVRVVDERPSCLMPSRR